ncbi:MAG TPA: tetratricopeptide repeat protein [Pyrinomonadaceae bacterium]|jgi:tetratricopeptide (TPR) repeat protein
MFSFSVQSSPGIRCLSLLRALLAVPLLFALSLSASYAQGGGGVDSTGTGGKHVIQGRIYFPSGQRADMGTKVKLQNMNSGELFVLADSNGTFSFRSLSPGSYTVLIEGGDKYETARETVLIDGEVSNPRLGIFVPSTPRVYQVQIFLQPKRSSSGGSKPGVLNAGLANVPEAARSLYEKALVSAQKGDSKSAVEQLRGALSHYPEFALALNELGVQYLKLGQPDRAVESLRAALKLKPDEFSPRLNYAIALLEKKETAEAEVQLRQALKKNETSWVAHMYLGIALITLRNYTEAEAELRRTLAIGGENLSLPHYYLGGIYWQKREYKRAAEELEKYLNLAPKAPNAGQVRATIKELRSK